MINLREKSKMNGKCSMNKELKKNKKKKDFISGFRITFIGYFTLIFFLFCLVYLILSCFMLWQCVFVVFKLLISGPDKRGTKVSEMRYKGKSWIFSHTFSRGLLRPSIAVATGRSSICPSHSFPHFHPRPTTDDRSRQESFHGFSFLFRLPYCYFGTFLSFDLRYFLF